MFLRHKERGSHSHTLYANSPAGTHCDPDAPPDSPPPHVQIQRREPHTKIKITNTTPHVLPTHKLGNTEPFPTTQHTFTGTHTLTHTLIRPRQALALLSHPHGSTALGAGAASPPQPGRGGACGGAGPRLCGSAGILLAPPLG